MAHDHHTGRADAHDHGHHDHRHDDHSHNHGSEAGHAHHHGIGGHSHAPADFGKAFAVGISLNVAFVLLEAMFGVVSHSVSLLADAGHNLSDVLGLVVAYAAHILTRRAPSQRFTYGLRGSSILAALFNAVFLLVVVGGLIWESVLRLVNPEPVAGATVMAVAGIGIVVNGVTAWLFASGRQGDINIRGAYLHMAADALVSLGVVVAGLVILVSGWTWVDPVTSIIVNGVIIIGTWSLLRDSVVLSLQGVPPGVDATAVSAHLGGKPGVTAIHDLHIWPISTTETALSAHLVMPGGHPGDAFLAALAEELSDGFGIGHPTLQIETSLDSGCRLRTGSACALPASAAA